MQAEGIINNVEIAFYVFYSVLLACGLFGMTTICCTYYCMSYNCNCFTYIWWILYSIMALLMFIAAGFFLAGSIFNYDVCTAYPYYFENQTNFNQLTFANDQTGKIFKTCFFENSTSIFTSFEDSDILNNFTKLKTYYSDAVPSSTFYSVVTTIEGKLANYAANPETISILNVTDSQQPKAALQDANTFANYSATNSGQTCNITRHYLVFNVIDCYPYLTDQPIGDNQCVVVSAAQNITDVIATRTTAFDNANCSSQGTIYSDNANALFAYRTSINTIV